MVVFALPAFAQEFRARYTAKRDLDVVLQVPPAEGALQAAAREGNPVQALNPMAPASYGSGQRYVAYEENDPYLESRRGPRPNGLRLFAFVW